MKKSKIEKNVQKVFEVPSMAVRAGYPASLPLYCHKNGEVYTPHDLFKMLKERYKPATDAAAIMVGIPIEYLETVRTILSAGFRFTKFRVRFRGPRYGNDYHTLKKNAKTFSVYRLI